MRKKIHIVFLPAVFLTLVVLVLSCANPAAGNGSGVAGDDDIFLEMVFVEGGTFTMGKEEFWFNTTPEHSVTVSSFYISKYEVTQKAYKAVTGSVTAYEVYGKGDDYPVYQVSWNQAVEFCNTLSAEAGLDPCYTISGSTVVCDFTKNGYRLPTEAEWEYAARGGNLSQGYTYSGSNTVGTVAWYNTNSYSTTQEVGTRDPNELGIRDMSGNVWEWCWDWYNSSYYTEEPRINPTGPAAGEYRVRRGGSYSSTETPCAIPYRESEGEPTYSWNNTGFRLVRSA